MTSTDTESDKEKAPGLTWFQVSAWQMTGAQYDLLGNLRNSVPKKVHEQSATASSQKIQLIKLPGHYDTSGIHTKH